MGLVGCGRVGVRTCGVRVAALTGSTHVPHAHTHTHTLNARPSTPCRTVVEGCATAASTSFVCQVGVRPVQPWPMLSGTCTDSPSRHNGWCSTTRPHPQVSNGFRTSLKCKGPGRIQSSHELMPGILDRIQVLGGGTGRQGGRGAMDGCVCVEMRKQL